MRNLHHFVISVLLSVAAAAPLALLLSGEYSHAAVHEAAGFAQLNLALRDGFPNPPLSNAKPDLPASAPHGNPM